MSVWQIHFEFEHFNAILPISVIYMKNYQISLQLNLKLSWSISNLNSMEYLDQIYWSFDKYTSNLNISLQLSLYISHFYEELPNIIATKHLINSDQLEIWLSAIYTPNLLSVWQIHFEFGHFNATFPIADISM